MSGRRPPIVTTRRVLEAGVAVGAQVPSGVRALRFERVFSDPARSPYDEVEWERRTVAIAGDGGGLVFEQDDVEVPESWSQTAATIVAHKYFHGKLGTAQRESSVRRLVSRVVDTIAGWGDASGYFHSDGDCDTFRDELASMLLHQVASFNSPVWFNVGVEERPQASACFILSCGDSMGEILDLAKAEAMLFKFGSGTGSNLSRLRGAHESLSSGGTASGPLSFMKGLDSFAGAIRSGGKTRRAAKMVILNIDHPDIVDFVQAKAREERKAWALIEAGYDGSFDGEAYASVFHQNANHSVRVTDEFLCAVEGDGEWWTKEVVTGLPFQGHRARALLAQIAEAAWTCGDPGIQYDTTIQRWNTVKRSGRIEASNPCSEFVFLDDTACNLASLNLLAFFDPATGAFDVALFRQAVAVLISAQEILVGGASYPLPSVAERSRRFRPLGLGFANLGALLMALGLPYDSDEGRAWAAAITSLMTGEAYLQSSRIAAAVGAYEAFDENRDVHLEVIGMHRDAARRVPAELVPPDLARAHTEVWDEALEWGGRHGYRNAQATVIAPTGTIAFMMDCDTTGIEPDLALVKLKKLAGGGTIRIVNRTVPLALRRLGYSAAEVAEVLAWLDEHGTIEGAPSLRAAHLPVFDCALRAAGGTRTIQPSGHLRMMASVQPCLSGAISKTLNLAADATPEDVAGLFLDAWKLGLKAIAIYRDGCKRIQPLATAGPRALPAVTDEAAVSATSMPTDVPAAAPIRRKLADERRSITHKFEVGGHEGYLTVGLYEDGQPGEIFLCMSKEGSTVSGLMDSFATAISLTLQYGVPLETLVRKFVHMRFEPSGFTNNREIPIAKSLVDYIFRWLGAKFLGEEERRAIGIVDRTETAGAASPSTGDRAAARARAFDTSADAPACRDCGSIMIRTGACYGCPSCGATSGCG
jgi:ribonucleoside-diphosphate reductase alpha chain